MNQTQQMNQNQAQQMNQMHHAINLNHALSVRSDVSIGQSLLKVDQIIEEARRHGYESVALVDDMTVSNMVELTHRARQAGLKPLIGCCLRVADHPTYRKAAHLASAKSNPCVMIKVFPASDIGMTALFKLLSKAHRERYVSRQTRVGWDDVLALEDVVLTTGDFQNLFGHPRHDEVLQKLVARLGKHRVFAELVPIATGVFDGLNATAIAAAQRFGIPTLATYPVLYQEDADASSLDVMRAIATQSNMREVRPLADKVSDFGFHPPMRLATRVAEMVSRPGQGCAVVRAWGDAMCNMTVFANLCQYEFQKRAMSLPTMAANEFDMLGQKCIAGWKIRLSKPVLGYQPSPDILPLYRARLRHELSVIQRMHFSGYFLLVEDLVAWAKRSGILVGPGRGSVGGSLVAFLMGVTEIDPIRFNLLFERFINPDRLDLPDADLDFMSSRRSDVIKYLVHRHGVDRVAGISNFCTLASASSLRETGRVHELDHAALAVTKLLPKSHGQPVPLSESADNVTELSQFRQQYGAIWRHALRLDGMLRSLGTHAAGVVVAGEPLVHRAVIERRTAGEGIGVVNWDKRTVEDWGLVKIDILGLSTLDILAMARQLIQTRHGKSIEYADLPLSEPDIMDSFACANTTGVFQFESPGMKKLLRDLAKGGPLSFDDIAVATALYRPGPMDAGLMADFVQIRQGLRSPHYDHPHMERALKATGSILVYQEQVMQLAVDVAGFSLADADRLRVAMGKKDKDKMEAMREQWCAGCHTVSGLTPEVASALFDKMAAFAGYGFNRSHAIGYSVISVWTMWLRVRYPAEFFAASLSVIDDDVKLAALVRDARECGIEILPPDINLSSDRFEIQDDRHLLTPFNKVTGISDKVAKRIVALREKRGVTMGTGCAMSGRDRHRFTSLAHFKQAANAKGGKVPVNVVDALSQVGALASIDPSALPARDDARRRVQMRLMPGLMVEGVKAERQTRADDQNLSQQIIQIVRDYRQCHRCDLAKVPHPVINVSATVKFMVVSDCPSWEEQRAGTLLQGEVGAFVHAAMKRAGLSPLNGYFTNLVKARKSQKYLSKAQIGACLPYLQRELDLIRPPIIVALGSAAIGYFLPDLKGSSLALAGDTVYDPNRDATIVCGINPQQLVFDPTRTSLLELAFHKVAGLLT